MSIDILKRLTAGYEKMSGDENRASELTSENKALEAPKFRSYACVCTFDGCGGGEGEEH